MTGFMWILFLNPLKYHIHVALKKMRKRIDVTAQSLYTHHPTLHFCDCITPQSMMLFRIRMYYSALIPPYCIFLFFPAPLFWILLNYCSINNTSYRDYIMAKATSECSPLPLILVLNHWEVMFMKFLQQRFRNDSQNSKMGF